MEGAMKGTVCVTGAGGYIASWLVKLLLSDEYKVHGTVRDPSDQKNDHLKKLDKASENLQLFKANLLDYDSLLLAIQGCDGVFHAASPVPQTKLSNPEVDLIAPAVTGTLNVLKACSKAKVKRVVVVSSCASVILNPKWPLDKPMDESCWSDKEYCKTTENWYFLSKLMAEEEALEYAKENGLDVVTVLPCLVLGPLLQATVNSSCLYLLNILKGARDTMVNSLQTVVDVRDVAEALRLTYENPEAAGRYICTSFNTTVSDFIAVLKNMFPNFKYPKSLTDGTLKQGLSSDKLKALGWKHRSMEETLKDTVKCFQDAGHI